MRICSAQNFDFRCAVHLAIAITVAAISFKPACGQDAAPNASRNAASSTTGVIEGVVVYEADSKRPWRYQRYYVKDRKAGLLAEAVVALDGAKLKQQTAAKAPRTVVMDQKDHRFVPETIAIAAGDEVKFTNSDPFVHNVFSSTTTQVFDATMGPGGAHVRPFARGLGIRRPVEIGCKLHSQMKAWIFVFDHPFFALTGEDGGFRLENVPPGEYELEMRHPAGELRSKQKVQVRAGETLRVEIRISPDDRAT